MAKKQSIDTGAAFEADLAAELENAEFRAIFEREYALARATAAVMEAVEKEIERQHLSKAEVARRIGRKREAVSRLLSGNAQTNPNLETIGELLYAVGLEAEITIKRAPQRKHAAEPLRVKLSA